MVSTRQAEATNRPTHATESPVVQTEPPSSFRFGHSGFYNNPRPCILRQKARQLCHVTVVATPEALYACA